MPKKIDRSASEIRSQIDKSSIFSDQMAENQEADLQGNGRKLSHHEWTLAVEKGSTRVRKEEKEDRTVLQGNSLYDIEKHYLIIIVKDIE